MNTLTPADVVAVAISALADRSRRGPASHATGAGTAWRFAVKIINGHHVQANLFGSDDVPVVWVDKSSEPLSIAEAAARVSM